MWIQRVGVILPSISRCVELVWNRYANWMYFYIPCIFVSGVFYHWAWGVYYLRYHNVYICRDQYRIDMEQIWNRRRDGNKSQVCNRNVKGFCIYISRWSYLSFGFGSWRGFYTPTSQKGSPVNDRPNQYSGQTSPPQQAARQMLLLRSVIKSQNYDNGQR